ncbi:MAG: ammonium transporter [Lyngbya sp.]|nr:ammonium transporter [Lyngbya sp.]
MIDTLWLLLCSCLVFLMQAGFMCLESGLTRSKNSINVAAKNLADFAVSALLFWAVGYGLMFGSSANGWLGSNHFGVNLDTAKLAAFFLFQVMFCGTSVTIVSGAVAERMKFSAYLLLVALVSGLIYPIFGHWAWNGADHGIFAGRLGYLGFVDFAGSTVVHSIGGWVSLAALLLIGSRSGRFPKAKPPQKIHSSNLQFSVLGTMLLWFGWLGFNGGSTLAFNEQVPHIMANTVLAGAGGMSAAGLLSWGKRKAPQVETLINGTLAGLVAITASCHAVTTPIAVIIGVTGAAVMILAEILLENLRIDDAVGAVAVHGGAGVWGTLAVGLFGQPELLGTGLERYSQIGVQLLGIFVGFGWGFGLAYLLLFWVNRIVPLRVSLSEEKIGLNISEHRAKTEIYDLFQVMEKQAQTYDLSLRAPVEPFTEVGLIAERYNAVMDALEEAVTRTEAIVKTAMNGIVTFDGTHLEITTANPSAATIFGYEVEELIGMSIHRLWQGVDDDEFDSEEKLLQELLKTGRHELIGCRADGSQFALEATVTQAKFGQLSFYTATFQDISQRKEAEAALRKSKARLKQKNQELERALTELKQAQTHLIQAEKMSSLGQMVAGIAHEINNPVSFIYGNIQPALDYTKDLLQLLELYQQHYPQPQLEIADYADEIDIEFLKSDYLQLLNSMRIGAERIRDIVRSLRNFSRLDEAEIKAVDLHEGIESTLLILQNRLKANADHRGIEVVRDYGKLPLVECYPSQLNQVFMNILSNAIDALEEHNLQQLSKGIKTQQYQIKIQTLLVDHQWIEIHIADNGPGMQEEVKSKLFDPFFTTKPVGKGTGLGLSISYKIVVEKHKGKIWCYSEPNQGTEFIIRIPRLILSITRKLESSKFYPRNEH